MSRMLEEASDRLDIDQDSLTVERVGWEPAPEGPVNRSQVFDMMEDALTQLDDRLNAHSTQIAEESLIGIMENLEDDHNMAFLRGLLRRATCFMLIPALSNENVRDTFKTVIIQVATSVPMVSAIVKAVVKEKEIMAPIERFVASQAKKEVSKAVKQSVILVPPSPPPFPSFLKTPHHQSLSRNRRALKRRLDAGRRVRHLNLVIGIEERSIKSNDGSSTPRNKERLKLIYQ